MLGEIADGHVVTGGELAGGERAPSGKRFDQGGLAGPVGAHQGDVLAALQPQLGRGRAERSDTHRPPGFGVGAIDLDTPVLQLEDHAAAALGGLESELERGGVAWIALDALDLGKLLDARLRLASLGGLGAEALDEALHARDLGLLLVDRLAERHLAGGLLAPPSMPGAGEEARAG